MERFLKLKDVAERIGLSRWTIARWIREGRGPAYRKSPGGICLFLERDVEEWIAGFDGTANRPKA